MKNTCLTSLLALVFLVIALSLQAQVAPIPEVTIAATVANTAEGGSAPGVFTITRGPGTNLTIRGLYTYNLRVFYIIGGAAANGADYAAITNYVTIPGGYASATITITPLEDTLTEGDETVSLTLTPTPMNSSYPYCIGAQSNAVITIADNDPRTTNLPPMVNITSPRNGVTFYAHATINIAADASDADGFVQQIEFFAGDTSLGVVTNNPYSMQPGTPWHITWSNVVEGTYTLTAVATDNERAVVTSDPVQITVATRPAMLIVTIAATAPNASETGPTPGVFTVARVLPDHTLSFWSNYPMRVFYHIGGTASNGVDYVRINNFVTIPANAGSATITITPIDDGLFEGPETVELELYSPVMDSQPGYDVASPSNAVVTIADNDSPSTNPPPLVEIFSPTNGSVFTAPANIWMFANASDPNGYVRTVEFFEGRNSLGVTTNDPNVMYFVNPFNLPWNNVPAGTYTLTAVATDDQGAQSVSKPVNITVQAIPPQQAVVTVVATDPYGSEVPVVFQSYPPRVDTAYFTISRTGSTGYSLTVYYRLGGTASNGVDYQRLSGAVTIPTGATSADVVVNPIDDLLVEGDETVVLRLEPVICPAIYPPPPSCYIVGEPNIAVAYILDNDTNPPPEPPVVTIVATDPNASEIPLVPPGMGMPQRYDPGVFTVTRTGGTDNPLRVFYYTASTAQNGIDYARLSNYVVIPAGAASTDIIVSPIDDNLVEGPETVFVQLRPALLPYPNRTGSSTLEPITPIVWPPPYAVGSPSNAVVTIADDDIAADTNYPPQVQLVRPMNNSMFRAPANILLVATAIDRDGSVSSVEFFEGDNSLGFGTPTAILSSVYPNGQFALVWSNVAAGKYTLTAKATDNQGAAAVSAPVFISVLATNLPPVTNTTPVVCITAIDSVASEGRFDFPTTIILQSNLLCTTAVGVGPTSTWVRLDPTLSNGVYWTNVFCGTNTATFEVRRSGPTNNSLTVYYSISGTASNGVDYVALPGSVTIPAGRRAAQIVIVPIDDTLVEYNETVILTLIPDSSGGAPAYQIGTASRAGAVILDNDFVLPPITVLRGGCFHVYLPAANGTGYRLETSSNLTTWTSRLTNIVDGSGVDYVDPDASGATMQFYRIVPEPVIMPEE